MTDLATIKADNAQRKACREAAAQWIESWHIHLPAHVIRVVQDTSEEVIDALVAEVESLRARLREVRRE